MSIYEKIKTIQNSDKRIMEVAQKNWDNIAKPLHSLGKLEDAIIKIAGIYANADTINIEKKANVVMCADNGVVAEGISQSGPEVTAIVANNFLKTESAVSIMCNKIGVSLFPYDVGIEVDTDIPRRKVAYGTKNMLHEAAMSRTEAETIIEIGINIVGELKAEGYRIISTGEMGIGNTTTSSAVASVLLNTDVEKVTGKGAGLSDEALVHKIDVIKKSIELNKPERSDAIDVISKVGGFDIAGLTGIFLGGAIHKIPIVIDGFISSVAALAAYKIEPKSLDYFLPSHISKEPACKMLLDEMKLEALLMCDMHLGEGTGAVALFPLLDLSAELYNKMPSFNQINMDSYEEL